MNGKIGRARPSYLRRLTYASPDGQPAPVFDVQDLS